MMVGVWSTTSGRVQLRDPTIIAQRRPTIMAPYFYWCRYLSGKEAWATKPGIAIQYVGSGHLRAALVKDDLIAIEVPKDASTRWKSRRQKNPNIGRDIRRQSDGE